MRQALVDQKSEPKTLSQASRALRMDLGKLDVSRTCLFRASNRLPSRDRLLEETPDNTDGFALLHDAGATVG